MKLTVIGASGSVSGPAGPSSCYLVQTDTTSVVLDLGSGAFGRLMDHIDPHLVDAVFLSHLHADHIVDLTALEVYLKYGPGAPHPAIPVYGPEATATRLSHLCSGDGSACDVDSFTIKTWQMGQPVTVGDITVEPFVALHPIEAYALRLTAPAPAGSKSTRTRVLAFSGDTDTCPGVIEAARGADLFLCEAAYQESRDEVRGVHLTGRRAGEVATSAQVSRLVLTHIPPWTDPRTVRAEACTAYSGPVDIAVPDAAWQL